MPSDLDVMLDRADAAVIIGDPALLALEERSNREERTGEELVYHDLAEEWRALTGLPFVSAVWAATGRARDRVLAGRVDEVLIRSRDHGLENINGLVAEWSERLPLGDEVLRTYFTANIHYVLDEECVEGMRCFFRMGADLGILPAFEFSMNESAV